VWRVKTYGVIKWRGEGGREESRRRDAGRIIEKPKEEWPGMRKSWPEEIPLPTLVKEACMWQAGIRRMGGRMEAEAWWNEGGRGSLECSECSVEGGASREG